MTLTPAQVAEILMTPVTSFVPVVDKVGTFNPMRYTYRMRWGSLTDPHRTTVVVMTAMEPTPEANGDLTVYYSPTCTQVHIGGTLLRDRYVGTGLYPFSYDPAKPAIIQDLAMMLNPLSTPALPAPCVTGL